MSKHRIIDAHCHIFPQKIALKATQGTQKFYDIPHSAFTGDITSLLNQCETTGVDKCLVTAVATTPHQVNKLNDFIAFETEANAGKLIGFGSMHPESESKKEDFEHLLELGLKGVKLHPDIQGFKVDDPRVMEILALCEDSGLPVLIHTGDSRYDNSNPDRMKNVLEAFKSLKVIGAHFGGWSVWEDAVRELAKYENFYVDTCSSFYILSKEEVKRIIHTYGTHRVIFGSDFPLWKQSDDIAFLENLELSDSELCDIFANNILNVIK